MPLYSCIYMKALFIMQNKYKKIINTILKTYPHSYQSVLNKKENIDILRYIIANTSKLNNICNLNTRIYWILHNIIDFPCCSTCNKKITSNVITIKHGYTKKSDKHHLFCCSSCAQKSKYTQKQKDKTKQIHFGNKKYNNREKAKSTMLKKYGVDNNMKSNIGKQEFFNAIRKKYNNETIKSVTQIDSVKSKLKKSLKEFFNSNKCIEYKKRQQKYWKNLSNKQHKLRINKIKQTYYKRTGYYWPSQNPNVNTSSNKYKFNGIKFDSFPELCYFIWLTNQNVNFVYKPKIQLVYSYNGIQHYYKPDFIVHNQLVEIKGDQFF